MFAHLEPIFLSQSRLAVMGLLYSQPSCDFISIQQKTKITVGNLSIQINKLKEMGYIEVLKNFKGNYPSTNCAITPKGIVAFEDFVTNINSYLKP